MATQFLNTLTSEERLAGWRLGAYVKMAEMGINPSAIDGHIKTAGPGATSALLSPTGMAKAIATVALLTGVPLGVAAHVVGKRVRESRGRETELNTQLGYYRNAAKQLETGLAASNTQV